MVINPEVMRRLVFAKSIFVNVDSLSRSPEPICYTSILGYHDSVDLFLNAAFDHLHISLNKKRDQIYLRDYWDLIDQELLKKSLNLSYRHNIVVGLNTARNNLKHNGILPNKGDFDSYSLALKNFFEENTPKIFGIDFSNISLAELIKDIEAKELLLKSEKEYQSDNFSDCIGYIGCAFHQLYQNFLKKTKLYSKDSPFYIRSPYLSRYDIVKIDTRDIPKIISDVLDLTQLRFHIDEVDSSLNSIIEALGLLTLNFDYKKYMKFKSIAPKVTFIQSNVTVTGAKRVFKYFPYLSVEEKRKRTVTKENCSFCHDYVIECAMKLQEFEIEIFPSPISNE